MTFKDLMEIYYAAKFKIPCAPDPESGVRVVVQTLCDDFMLMGKRDFSSDFDIKKSRVWFDEILSQDETKHER